MCRQKTLGEGGGGVWGGGLLCGLEALTGESQQEGVAPGSGIKFNRAGKGQLRREAAKGL